MMKTRLKEYSLLAACAAVVYLWLMVDQAFLPYDWQRFAALPLVTAGVLTLYFFILKPAEPFDLAKRVSNAIGILTAAAVLLQHVVIRFDITYKALIIFWIVVLVPYAAAGIYQLRQKTTRP